ncbi:MAG: penicillin-binding protein [Eubacteriaceae bacterium]|nr:penicillin-binding protein [Eubacteriaceae bacterium]
MKKFIKNLFILCFIAALLFVAYLVVSLPDISNYAYRPPSSSVVLSREGDRIGEIASRNVTYISREQIPDTLVHAVVAVEDKRFYRHFGIDVFGIGRSMIVNFREGEVVEGASTITQQTATLLFFDKQVSYIRKIREAMTSVLMDYKYTKDEIITIYLNEVYFGAGAYGVYEASQTYFSKEPMDLLVEECAMLAGIITAPSAYSPVTEKGYGYANQRKEKVLGLMVEQGYLSNVEAEKAKSSPVAINPTDTRIFSKGTCSEGFEAYMNLVYEKGFETLIDYYRNDRGFTRAAAEKAAEDTLFSENTTINATISNVLQTEALESMKNTLENNSELLDCAFVFVDNTSGEVLGYYGSKTYIDMAQKARAPGSVIKPLYMGYLIDNGIINANTLVVDEPITIAGYSPSNYDSYHGLVTMRDVLAKSLNSASLRLYAMAPSTNQIIDYVKNLGITTITDQDKAHPYPFALGGMSNGVKPIEMAPIYGAISNGGIRHEAVYISSIILEDTTIVFANPAKGTRIFNASTAGTLKSCLESAVCRGTAIPANPGYSTMGKTGTTDNFTNVWFCGSTANVSASIWMGNIDAKRVDNLSTLWCMTLYKNSIAACISKGSAINEELLAPPGTEKTIHINCLKQPMDGAEISEFDIGRVEILEQEIDSFLDYEVVYVEIDAETQMLFKRGSCLEANKMTKIVLKKDAPIVPCDKEHPSSGQ